PVPAGALVTGVLAPGAATADGALLAHTLSPLARGGPVAVLLGLGMTPVAAARAVAVAIAVLALIAATWPGRGSSEPDGPAPWLAAVAWTTFVAALVLGNPHLLPRSDGWFHAAVTLEVAQRGLPVEDPFFAGLRLLYFWGAHVWAASWLVLAPGLSVWTPLIALDLSAAVAVMLGVTLLARRLGAGTRGQLGAAALAVAGCAPFAWVWLVGRLMLGSVTGRAEARQLLTHGVGPVMASMNQGTLHSSMAFFGDKFLIATPFGLGLALFLAATLALLDAIERPSPRVWIRIAVLQTAALFLHSVVGWVDAILAAGWWWWALARSRRPGERPLARRLAPLAVAFGAAVLVLWPYLRATTAGKHQGLHFGLDGPTLRTWLMAGLAYVPAGMTWLWVAARRGGAARELLGMTTTLTLAALFLGLPLGNQSKVFNLLFVLLAAPAALGLRDLATRGPRWRVAVTAMLVAGLLPTMALFTWGFATERGQLHDVWDTPASPDERAAWNWTRAHLPADAIIVDADARLDMTVLAGRSVLWGGDGWAKNWGYDPRALASRRAGAATLGAGLGPTDETRRMLGKLGREVVVVARRTEPRPEGSAWARLVTHEPGIAPGDPTEYVPLYRNDTVALFRWSGVR
ncbi:MAG: hypothetical protein ACHQ52_14530, partial [Candidatus Eisenbacteria bacterium]